MITGNLFFLTPSCHFKLINLQLASFNCVFLCFPENPNKTRAPLSPVLSGCNVCDDNGVLQKFIFNVSLQAEDGWCYTLL